MAFQQQSEGEICNKCNKAKIVKNPNKGTVFCEDKCWLKGAVGNMQVTKPQGDTDGWGKCKYGFLLESYKKEEELAKAEPRAELWADACMRNSKTTPPPVPVVDVNEEIDVENLPF